MLGEAAYGGAAAGGAVLEDERFAAEHAQLLVTMKARIEQLKDDFRLTSSRTTSAHASQAVGSSSKSPKNRHRGSVKVQPKPAPASKVRKANS